MINGFNTVLTHVGLKPAVIITEGKEELDHDHQLKASNV